VLSCENCSSEPCACTVALAHDHDDHDTGAASTAVSGTDGNSGHRAVNESIFSEPGPVPATAPSPNNIADSIDERNEVERYLTALSAKLFRLAH